MLFTISKKLMVRFKYLNFVDFVIIFLAILEILELFSE